MSLAQAQAFPFPQNPRAARQRTGCYKKIRFGGNSGRTLSGTNLHDLGHWFSLLLNDLFAAPPRYKAERGFQLLNSLSE